LFLFLLVFEARPTNSAAQPAIHRIAQIAKHTIPVLHVIQQLVEAPGHHSQQSFFFFAFLFLLVFEARPTNSAAQPAIHRIAQIAKHTIPVLHVFQQLVEAPGHHDQPGVVRSAAKPAMHSCVQSAEQTINNPYLKKLQSTTHSQVNTAAKPPMHRIANKNQKHTIPVLHVFQQLVEAPGHNTQPGLCPALFAFFPFLHFFICSQDLLTQPHNQQCTGLKNTIQK
jgi:hypothetical protein